MSTDPVPEGHDEQVARDLPAPRRTGLLAQWPIVLVMIGVLASLSVIALGYFRRGSVLLAGTVVLAMFLRLLLREDEAGLLAVRSKMVDVATLAVLGVALAVLAFAVPAPA